MLELDLAPLRQCVQRLDYRPLFVTVSGTHLYGFPSADTDVDLRGCQVALRLVHPGHELPQPNTPALPLGMRQNHRYRVVAAQASLLDQRHGGQARRLPADTGRRPPTRSSGECKRRTVSRWAWSATPWITLRQPACGINSSRSLPQRFVAVTNAGDSPPFGALRFATRS